MPPRVNVSTFCSGASHSAFYFSYRTTLNLPLKIVTTQKDKNLPLILHLLYIYWKQVSSLTSFPVPDSPVPLPLPCCFNTCFCYLPAPLAVRSMSLLVFLTSLPIDYYTLLWICVLARLALSLSPGRRGESFVCDPGLLSPV